MLKYAWEESGPTTELRDPASGTFRHDDRGDLAYALHDARNLLSVIVANVDWLRKNADVSVVEAVDDVASATERLRKLLEATLAMADRGSGCGSLVYRLARVSEIVRDATAGFRRPPRGIRLNVAARGDDVVEVDAPLVTRLIANLLSNAVRHSPDRGVISVDILVAAGRLTLIVSDQGCGIEPTKREEIFTPGAVGSVHGLGLAFCRRVALEHGGAIDVAPSERGACFVVVLPAGPPTTEYGAPEAL